jgi:hypothetical protein
MPKEGFINVAIRTDLWALAESEPKHGSMFICPYATDVCESIVRFGS